MSGDIGDYAVALDALDRFSDRFDWNRILGSTYGLSELDRAMDAMRAMAEIKPVLDPSRP
ncbi:hypothetical protein ACFQV8_13985 [Pseudonocardia benzenivorans]